MRVRKRPLSDQFAALMVVLLLLLTALGNALLLFIFALAGLLAGMYYYRGSMGRGGALTATAAFTAALIIALFMLFR